MSQTIPMLLPRELRAHDGAAEITEWCPVCLERVIAMRNGTCGFCDTPVVDEPAAVERPALRVADPVPEKARIPRRRERGHNHGKAYTDEQIIARIQLWARLTGRPPSKADWTPARLRKLAATARGIVTKHLQVVALYELGDFPSETTVRTRCGSLNAALVQAGYEPRSAGRQPTGPAPATRRRYYGAAELRARFEETLEHRDGDTARCTRSAVAQTIASTRKIGKAKVWGRADAPTAPADPPTPSVSPRVHREVAREAEAPRAAEPDGPSTRERVVEILARGPERPDAIAHELGLSPAVAALSIRELYDDGRVAKIEAGKYELLDDAHADLAAKANAIAGA